jgi:hypothetical protein
MSAIIKRQWTAEQADEWTREDWVAIVVSPIAYMLLMVGTALSLLLFVSGFVLLTIGIGLTLFMHWVIDPKLRAISDEYERKQAHYIEDLERTARWEKKNG